MCYSLVMTTIYWTFSANTIPLEDCRCPLRSQQARDVHPMLVQYWPIVYDDGPTLYQHWVDISCLLGE